MNIFLEDAKVLTDRIYIRDVYCMYTIYGINSLTFSGLCVVKVAFWGVLREVL